MKSANSNEDCDFGKNENHYFQLKEKMRTLIASEADNLDNEISELDAKITSAFNNLISMRSVTTHNVLTKATFIINDIMKDTELTEYHQDAFTKLLNEFQTFIKVK